MEQNGAMAFYAADACDRRARQGDRELHAEEGGVAGRGARYRENCRLLVDGMRALGFETLLPDALQAPIIVTFHMPSDPRFDFERSTTASARGAT